MIMYWLVVVILGLALSHTIAYEQYNRVLRKAERTQAPSSNSWSECGKSEKIDTTDKGFRNVTLGEHPWMAALGYRTKNKADITFRCGATLISDRWVITGSTCVENLGSTTTLEVVRLGDLDLDSKVQDGATPVDIAVEQIIIHPETSQGKNDIALLKLKDKVTFTKYIRPVCVLSGADYIANSFYSGKSGFITGWGTLEWHGLPQTKLHETNVPIVEPSKCAEAYASRKAATIDEKVLCAGAGPGRDACQGDSGGPLVFSINNKFYLGGIISFGVKCFDPNYPGVYTRVAVFSDWIGKTTGLTL